MAIYRVVLAQCPANVSAEYELLATAIRHARQDSEPIRERAFTSARLAPWRSRTFSAMC